MQFLLGLFVGFAAGALAVWVMTRPKQPAPRPSAPSKDEALGAQVLAGIFQEEDKTKDLRQNLRVKFLYDEKKVDDAIEAERQRDPQAREEELMRAAIFRWERENR